MQGVTDQKKTFVITNKKRYYVVTIVTIKNIHMDDEKLDKKMSENDEERIERELEEFDCTCGAYVINMKSCRIVHIYDCLCGYG